jgi:peroxiredoxin
MSRAELNKPAPNFTLTDFTGREINLTDFQDKKNILLVFNRGFV